jgi:hypothetical protein
LYWNATQYRGTTHADHFGLMEMAAKAGNYDAKRFVAECFLESRDLTRGLQAMYEALGDKEMDGIVQWSISQSTWKRLALLDLNTEQGITSAFLLGKIYFRYVYRNEKYSTGAGTEIEPWWNSIGKAAGEFYFESTYSRTKALWFFCFCAKNVWGLPPDIVRLIGKNIRNCSLLEWAGSRSSKRNLSQMVVRCETEKVVSWC